MRRQAALADGFAPDRWELFPDELPGDPPIVMTSTPDGRLFLVQLQWTGSDVQPRLFFTRDPVGESGFPQLMGLNTPYWIPYVEDGQPVPAGGVTEDPAITSDPVNFKPGACPSLSRISTDTTSSKIRVSYPTLNLAGSPKQEYRVVTVEVRDPDDPPAVRPLVSLTAANPDRYSLLHATFVEPDFVDLSLDRPANTSLLYWIEAAHVSRGDDYATRGMIFEGDFETSCPLFLSFDATGAPGYWTGRPVDDFGDYMNGGFFFHEDSLNYVAQWNAYDTVRANVVTLPYRAPIDASVVADKPVTVVLESGDWDEITTFGLQFDDSLLYEGWSLQAMSSGYANGRPFYHQIWRPGTEEEVAGFDIIDLDFANALSQQFDGGWRVRLLDAFTIPEGGQGGHLRYHAVWRRPTDPDESEHREFELPADEFAGRYNELAGQGWRLKTLAAAARDGQVYLTAAWEQRPDEEQAVFGWTYGDYRPHYDSLWPQGWRLHLLRTVDVDGQVLYWAVWRRSTAGEGHAYEVPYRDFRRAYDRDRCDGWRIRLLG
jgi:hypothetical protein